MIRIFDIVLSIIGLIIFFPLFLIISILIKLDSPGPIFYKQFRIGKGGKKFLLLKFRTMFVGSDKNGLLTQKNDKRITHIGKFLRKYKIDELPQLINVLKGEMSMVGPRPEVEKYINKLNKEQLKILNIRPGITDYASLKYYNENELIINNDESYYVEKILPEKIKYNFVYINNYNLINYFKIIFLTILKILIPGNIFEEKFLNNLKL